jgi:WG containing repeat
MTYQAVHQQPKAVKKSIILKLLLTIAWFPASTLEAIIPVPVFRNGVCIFDTSNPGGYPSGEHPATPSIVAIDRLGKVVRKGLPEDAIGGPSLSEWDEAATQKAPPELPPLPYKEGDRHGLRHATTGEIVIPAKWDRVEWVAHAKRAVAKSGGICRILNERGEPVSEDQWDMVLLFSENPAVVERNGKRGLIDPGTGRVLAKPEWDDIEWRNGVAVAMTGSRLKGDESWRILNKQGEPISEDRWRFVRVMDRDAAIVTRDGREGVVDPTSGKIILPPEFQRVFKPNRNHESGELTFIAIDVAGIGRLHDASGKELFELDGLDAEKAMKIDWRALQSWDDIIRYPRREGWGAVEGTGKVRIPFIYESVGRELGHVADEGMVTIALGGRFGFVDLETGLVLDPRWDACGHFSEGLCYVSHGDRWGFINKTGKVVIGPHQMGPLSK